ncbi:hypothetical protein [Streptomyces sp. KS 21]|uniref:hypothetical protein n=1 Tax=Streptomyces sp. KS 21 TaxID=2485150 RepID=UPI001062D8A3|nr:hypothetical protein [Streptomyces sp. KS 21]TDU79731.1 hypothetical protein EDD91_6553 [Streptomyces sp. KS 21]
MRLRTVVVAAASALTLLVAVPGSATAATGEFGYSYVGLDGEPRQERLLDPESDECVGIPEVADPNSSEPAFSPRNRTDAVARVFTNADCTGDHFDLRAFTGHGSERLKLRSVVFLP